MERLFREFKASVDSRLSSMSNNRLVLAISGGVDSMVMLSLFVEVSRLREYEFQLSVAHFDHQLRETSHVDASVVANYCKQMGIPCYTECWDSEQHTTSNIEATAREARYAFLERVAQTVGASTIVTAHHADDQVETALMRLIKGTSFRSVGGIREWGQWEQYHMWRPLLSVRKSMLRQYAIEHDIPFVEDESNHSTDFYRNRIRHQVIPMLEDENPNFVEGMVVLQDEMQSFYEAHVVQFQQNIDSLLIPIKYGWELQLVEWQKLPRAVAQVYFILVGDLYVMQVTPTLNRKNWRKLFTKLYENQEQRWQEQLPQEWVVKRSRMIVQIVPLNYENNIVTTQ